MRNKGRYTSCDFLRIRSPFWDTEIDNKVECENKNNRKENPERNILVFWNFGADGIYPQKYKKEHTPDHNQFPKSLDNCRIISINEVSCKDEKMFVVGEE